MPQNISVALSDNSPIFAQRRIFYAITKVKHEK